MTPTLAGRIQTRLVLLLLIGLPVGVGFGLAMHNLFGVLAVLGLAFGIGLPLDWLYQQLQARRWDGDWPPLYSVATGILEGILLWLLMQMASTSPLHLLPTLPNRLFWLMYGIIWFAMFGVNLGILNIFWPYRRFHGGKFWP